MQFHQEVRAYRHVEALGQVGHLDPGCDAANSGHIRLHDAAGALLQVFAKLAQVVHRLAHRHRDGRVLAQLAVTRDIFGGKRLFDPRQVERRKRLCTAHHLGPVEALVGVGHEVERGAYCRAHGCQTRNILADMRSTDLDLGALEAVRLGLQRLFDQLSGTEM